MMPPYDPFAFGQPPDDAVLDTDAMLDLASGPNGYAPQPDMPFLEENADLPPSDVDPRGMLKGDYGTAPAADPPQADMAPMGEAFDEEALRQAILDDGTEANDLAEQYQTGVVEQNEEEERRLSKMNGGV